MKIKMKKKKWLSSKTQMMTKFKNTNCDKTQTLKIWQNSKTQILMKLKNSNCDETQKLQMWWSPKTDENQKLKNLKCDKTYVVTKLKNLIVIKLKTSKGELLFSSVGPLTLIYGHWLCFSSNMHPISAQHMF